MEIIYIYAHKYTQGMWYYIPVFQIYAIKKETVTETLPSWIEIFIMKLMP